MKRALKILIVVAVVIFVGIQFIRPNISSPPIIEGDTLEASTQVPDQVETIVSRSCADCHTNKTVFPWYSQVAPVSWWLANHISEGKRHLNLSTWGTLDTKRKMNKLKEMCEQVDSGEMPLPSYLWIHRDAVLKGDEGKALCEWTEAERNRLSSIPATAN